MNSYYLRFPFATDKIDEYNTVEVDCKYFDTIYNVLRHVKKLTLRNNFCNSCPSDFYNKLPETLIELHIHASYFNEPLDNLPITLKKLLICSFAFNQKLDYLPESLKELTIMYVNYFSPYKFNQPLDLLPKSLEILSFYTPPDYKHELINLPNNLKDIYLENYNKSINLPVSLTKMNLRNTFNNDDSKEKLVKLTNLEELILSEFKNEKLLNFPVSLTKLMILKPQNIFDLKKELLKLTNLKELVLDSYSH